MISRFFYALSVLALAPDVAAIAFPGPQPTLVERNLAVQHGVSPKPTKGPDSEYSPLVKRAIASADTCGWVWDPVSSQSQFYAT